jgi:phenylacetate-CoA ligase
MSVLNSYPEIDYKSSAQIEEKQLQRIRETLCYVRDNSPYYKRLFAQHAFDVSQVNNYAELKKLPLTTKADLAQYNDDFLCIPLQDVADFNTTSGTTGRPIASYQSKNDLERLAYNEALSMLCTGANANDVFQLMTTVDKRFMAGLAYYLGIQKIGAGIVRNGPGAIPLQWDSILRFKPTVLIAIPSFIPDLIDYAERNGIDYKNSSVKKIICIGQPLRNEQLELNELGKAIASRWDVQLFSTYASTEMATAFTECEAGKGGHLPSELIFLEVLDENGNQVEHGESGEVVITTFGVEAMPLIRYKTGDVCHYYNEPCSCGRTTPRLGPVIGRKNQMLKVKGTTIFPSAIYAAVEKVIPEADYLLEISSGDYSNDHIAILIDNKHIAKAENLSVGLKSSLRMMPELKFIDKVSMRKIKLPDDVRKPLKFIDRRK